ncbi:TPA: hypothetical protein N0F65_006838 [Lagenidium giganteum]|uniref:TOG domain-containing protein n=1 Tax=Lagenidium giganteum TaxID=4803 RepID=A0AAV2ZEH8_9STRA|nr:TPA: hypothetical protein N0F65_006838 [Lagenidium giganteum]
MPTLLSPRKSEPKLVDHGDDEDALKTLPKRKSMMGRIKSKLSTKLGIKKQSSSASLDVSPTDKDLRASIEPESVVLRAPPSAAKRRTSSRREDDDEHENQHHSHQREQKQQNEELHEEVVRSAHAESKETALSDDTVHEFDAKHLHGKETPVGRHEGPQPQEAETEVLQFDGRWSEDSESHTSLRSPAVDVEADGDDGGDPDEEVFASDYPKGNGGGQEYSDDEEDDDEPVEVFDEQSNDMEPGNQTKTPATDDIVDVQQLQEQQALALMVIGLSPNKIRAGPAVSLTMAPSPPSPVQIAAPPSPSRMPSPAKSASGPGRKLAMEPAIDAKARTSLEHRGGPDQADCESKETRSSSSAASQAKDCGAKDVDSKDCGAKAQPLLSDFAFGGEGPVAAGDQELAFSPLKRRGAGAPPARFSYPREQEQQLIQAYNATYPSSPMKNGTVGANAAASNNSNNNAGSNNNNNNARGHGRRPSLQGIQEEVSSQITLEHLAPRAASPKRTAKLQRKRSQSMMEAPILASSFANACDPAEPDGAKPDGDDPDQQDAAAVSSVTDEKECANAADQGNASAFAFDAGAAITQEFGERVARMLGADPWGDRQDGFDAIQYVIKKTDLGKARNKRELFCAAIAAIQGGVEDRVAPVMYCALECFRAVVKEFAPVLERAFVKYQPMNEQLANLARSLIGKLADSNKRTQREAAQALLRLAKLRKLKTLPHILLHLSAREVAPRQRVDVLHLLVREIGVDAKLGLSIDVVMQFALPALKIAEERTRKAAVELVADLHLVNGQAVNAQLVGIKPEMLRVINRRVDELLAKREQEASAKAAQAQASTNQADDLAGDDDVRGVELVAVPAEDSTQSAALLEAQLALAATVVGPVLWRKLESKTWSDRKEALVDVDKSITEAKSDLRDVKAAFGSIVQHNFLAYCVILHRCLADSIAPVVNSAMDCFSTLVKVYGPCVEWREENVRDVILLTTMRLFSTMQKPNNRTNRAACRCVLKLTRLTNAHTLRYTLSCIFAKETDPLVQMHLLRLLIPEFGYQSEGLSATMVLAAVSKALGHSNDKVRKIAMDVALCTQRLVGKELVLAKLQDVKPSMLKELEKNFVDCEMKKDGERPQTVHLGGLSTGLNADGNASAAGARLPPVQFAGGESSRRLLHSAPVGVGRLHCTPQAEEQNENEFTGSFRRGSVLSNEEENLMDSILDTGDF